MSSVIRVGVCVCFCVFVRVNMCVRQGQEKNMSDAPGSHAYFGRTDDLKGSPASTRDGSDGYRLAKAVHARHLGQKRALLGTKC